MFRSLKLAAVSVVLLVNAACLEITSKVTLAADGSANVAVSSLVMDSFLDVLEEMGSSRAELEEKMQADMPAALSPDQVAALERAGGKVNRLDFASVPEGLRWGVDVSFASIAGVAGVEDGALGKSMPDTVITDLGDGTYKLVMTSSGVAEPGAGSSLMPTPDGSEKKKKKSKKGGADELEALGKMMAEAVKMRIAFAVDVPGQVLSVEPADGVITGGQVEWVIDGKKMMSGLSGLGDAVAATEDGAAGEAPPAGPPDTWTVTFKMPEGQRLPASVVRAP
jgi:hypothetical protein